MKITNTNANGTIGIATDDNGRLEYNCLDSSSLLDTVDNRDIWRGESINMGEVKDRYSIRDTQLWTDAIALHQDIRDHNNKVAEANKIKEDQELDVITRHIADRRNHSGWCDKCHSYCYGDCEAN